MIKIEFEGTDGAGKTTGLKYFIERSKLIGKRVVETREVGNPHIPSCVKMRELVLNPENKMSGEAMELVFSAMRYESELWMKNLKKSLDKPDFIISDRGFFSHVAYGIHNTSEAFVDDLFLGLMSQYTSLPQVVIYFDVDPKIALERRNVRGEAEDAIELKGIQYQSNVRDSYKKELSKYGDQVRVYHVDANQSLENVRRQLDVILDDIEMEVNPSLWA